jgi:hypothetical protein
MDAKSLLLLSSLAAAYGQSFNSGSTGADGALVFTTPGTIFFDPQSFNPKLNPSDDNVYQFTSIYVGKGVTLRLSSTILHSPLFWLAQGPVEINGAIVLDGEDGGPSPSVAGAGGYPGGSVQKTGYGPEHFTPNVFLVPLVGGRGGDGGTTQGGGAGGGALLIASSTSISINGAITADGGGSSDGMGGNGGAIRLVAPIIEGSGLLSAKGGQPGGVDGLVRFEDFDNHFSGSLNSTPFAQGKPFGLFLPPAPPASVRIVSIGGVDVKTPNVQIGRHQDIVINQDAPVTLTLEAHYIPPGTVIQLEFLPEVGPSWTGATTPLEGTFAVAHATASVTFARGVTHTQVKATWNNPSQAR